MASLYKKPIVVTDQKTRKKVKKKSDKWWGRYTDALGRDKRVPLAKDKAAAQAMLNSMVRKAEQVAAGIVDTFDENRKRPLSEHLKDYRKYLEDKGSTKDHVNTTIQRASAVIEECKFQRLTDVSASRVLGFLADLRGKGRSVASSNHYLRAIKMFMRWLVKDRRSNDDPIAHLAAMNADIDRRRIRRPLTSEEFNWLITTTETATPIQNIPGPDRVILYIVGGYTGYRRNEIGSVREQSFDFASEPATMTVEAGYSKHRRKDVIPLRSDFSKLIKNWIARRPDHDPGTPLFDVTDKRTGEMLKADLERAREEWIEEAETAKEQEVRERSSFLCYVDHNGHYADFHALRKTFITNLSKAGVSPKMAQTLARHSDINLTMNTYTMLGVYDQVEAVESLPPLPVRKKPRQRENKIRATGTDDAQGDPGTGLPVVPSMVPRSAKTGAIRLAAERYDSSSVCTQTRSKTSKTKRARKAKRAINSDKEEGYCSVLHQDASNFSQVPEVGLEPTRGLPSLDFESSASAIPPLRLLSCFVVYSLFSLFLVFYV